MSGTSLDGVDVAYCRFDRLPDGIWNVETLHTHGEQYPEQLLIQLKKATSLSPADLCILDKQLGFFFGEVVNTFLELFNIPRNQVNAIASHGQTIFHQPENGFTLQIGCGTNLAITSGISVINDFRSKDISLGGQGAPLVPIGDHLLFSHLADAFLNIGGFSNISFPRKLPISAFDICPGNLPLNHLMEEHYQMSYDENGDKARSGTINESLLHRLNNVDFYTAIGPKSLGTEWLYEHFMPFLNDSVPPEDLLSTVVEHIATQIATTINQHSIEKVLATGGGARNSYLIERIQSKIDGEILLPSEELIDFKEAIVFGFLGALYLSGENNILNSVTGARKSSRGGILHTP